MATVEQPWIMGQTDRQSLGYLTNLPGKTVIILVLVEGKDDLRGGLGR